MSLAKYNILTEEPPAPACQTEAIDVSDGPHSRTFREDPPRKIPARDLCRLARQLATLLRAAMPLVPALSALVEQLRQSDRRKLIRLDSRQNYLADIMQQVTDDVNAGDSLADAMKKHGNVFSPLFVSMVAAGQESGTLEDVLARLARMLEKRVNLTGKVKSAMAYPIMMALVAVGVVVFLLSVVVPGLTEIFIEMNHRLPLPTRLLISTSSFMQTYFWLIAVMACGAVCGIGLWHRTPEGRSLCDRYKLNLPVFGSLLLKLEIARLTRTLGILLTSGIGLIEALDIVKKVVQNSLIVDAIGDIKEQVSTGGDVAEAVRQTKLFPPVVFHIIATGQASGNIESALIDIADMYDIEVDRQARTLVSLLEPAILLAMGAIVGFIVLAVVLPIFEINQVL